jgi:hypothetical protein
MALPRPLRTAAAGTRRRSALVAGIWAILGCLVAGVDPAASSELEPFFGAYVGTASVEDFEREDVEQRDLDIVIEPYDESGFRLHWVNVTLVDGRRDVPGVERRLQTVLFQPAEAGSFYIEATEENPFREREAMRPMAGDPIRWATVRDGRMDVFSFVVLNDGRYELQIYERRLDGHYLDIQFQRLVDGVLEREIVGRTVRANLDGAE